MPPKFYKHKGGVPDKEMYEIARRQRRIIITYNIDDFKKLIKHSSETGVIGITQSLTPDQLDSKLNAFLSKHSENSLYGKYTPLSF